MRSKYRAKKVTYNGMTFDSNKSKYKSKRVTYNGMTFDSKKEFNRYLLLKEREERGEISNLQRQVKFVLIPAQREADTIGKRGGIKKGKLLERETSYFADFTYFDNVSGESIVEDTKGFKTADYKIKRKLMLYVHNIKIREV